MQKLLSIPNNVEQVRKQTISFINFPSKMIRFRELLNVCFGNSLCFSVMNEHYQPSQRWMLSAQSHSDRSIVSSISFNTFRKDDDDFSEFVHCCHRKVVARSSFDCFVQNGRFLCFVFPSSSSPRVSSFESPWKWANKVSGKATEKIRALSLRLITEFPLNFPLSKISPQCELSNQSFKCREKNKSTSKRQR